MTDTRAIKPEDNVGGTFTQQLTIAEVTTAYVSPVPTVAPGVIVCEPGTVNEEAIHYKTKDAGAGTISGLTRDYTNLNSGTGIQHENGEDWEIYQNALYVANLVDILTEGYLREQQTVARTAATTFTVVGNVAALYTTGRVVRFNGDNTEVETVVSSSYSAGTGLTTVTVTGSIPDPLTYVEVGIQPKAAAFVQTIGDQTVAGVKTFSSSPVVPDPTTAQQAASKAYVDTATVAKAYTDDFHNTKAYAYLSADQLNIANTTFTKVAFDTELFDIGSNFDTSNNRFVAPVTGYYLVSSCLNWVVGSLTANTKIIYAIYVNGSLYGKSRNVNTAGAISGNSITSLVYLTATQYVEMFAYHDNGDAVPDVESDGTFISVVLMDI